MNNDANSLYADTVTPVRPAPGRSRRGIEVPVVMGETGAWRLLENLEMVQRLLALPIT